MNNLTEQRKTDAERFSFWLNKAAIECNLDTIKYDDSGRVREFIFKDGSRVDGITAWFNAGMKEKNFK